MKKQIPSFAAGMLTMALIGSISVGALAATGQLTINVDPVNIQVKGETFQPKDPSGKEVPVFAYQGTTYAPLRALAEAYGLEVGYDKTANMATVAEPGSTATPSTPPTTDYSKWSAEEEKAYQEFKGMWKVVADEIVTDPEGNSRRYASWVYNGPDKREVIESYLKGQDAKEILIRCLSDLSVDNANNPLIRLYFASVNNENEMMRISLHDGALQITG